MQKYYRYQLQTIRWNIIIYKKRVEDWFIIFSVNVDLFIKGSKLR